MPEESRKGRAPESRPCAGTVPGPWPISLGPRSALRGRHYDLHGGETQAPGLEVDELRSELRSTCVFVTMLLGVFALQAQEPVCTCMCVHVRVCRARYTGRRMGCPWIRASSMLTRFEQSKGRHCSPEARTGLAGLVV